MYSRGTAFTSGAAENKTIVRLCVRLTEDGPAVLRWWRELEEYLSYSIEVLSVAGVALQAELVLLAQDRKLRHEAPDEDGTSVTSKLFIEVIN